MGVDGGEAFEFSQGLREVRDHAPPHGHELTPSRLSIGANDRLKCGGSDVALGREYEALRSLPWWNASAIRRLSDQMCEGSPSTASLKRYGDSSFSLSGVMLMC